MAEPFLEEQLKRIREMTRQMSRLRPLHDIPKARSHGSPKERSSAHDEPARARPHAPRVPNRRRGR
jgi:hypothetical protein